MGAALFYLVNFGTLPRPGYKWVRAGPGPKCPTLLPPPTIFPAWADRSEGYLGGALKDFCLDDW